LEKEKEECLIRVLSQMIKDEPEVFKGREEHRDNIVAEFKINKEKLNEQPEVIRALYIDHT
jgi:hypothetical protein